MYIFLNSFENVDLPWVSTFIWTWMWKGQLLHAGMTQADPMHSGNNQSLELLHKQRWYHQQYFSHALLVLCVMPFIGRSIACRNTWHMYQGDEIDLGGYIY